LKFEVFVLPTAQDELQALPRKFQQQIRKKIDTLYDSDFPPSAKILNSKEGYRRLRSGDYRIIYKVAGKKITVAKIGIRKTVYLGID
jgi:mRNA interferase RelE/StbE